MTYHPEIPFGAPGMPEEERLRRLALRVLELVRIHEVRRAPGAPLEMADHFSTAAARWGFSMGKEREGVTS